MATHQSDIPYFAEGEVVSGFGRGSKELGIPTANFPESVIRQLPASFECGVYYGWAKLSSYPQVFKMTMCVGWNPYFHNTVKTMETHIIHQFNSDFYGDVMKVIVLGFMRPMCDFPSLDALIKAIHNDIDMASKNLDTKESLQFKDDPFFMSILPSTIPEKVAAGNNVAMVANQSMSSEDHEKQCEPGDSSPPVSCTLNSETNEMNCHLITSDLMPRKDPSAPVAVNGIHDSHHNHHSSRTENSQNSNSSFCNADSSQSAPTINCSDLCKGSI